MELKYLNRQFKVVHETDSLLDSAASLVGLSTDYGFLLVRRFDGGFSVLTPSDITKMISNMNLPRDQNFKVIDFPRMLEKEIVVNRGEVSQGEMRFKLQNSKNQRVVVMEGSEPVGLAHIRWKGEETSSPFTQLQDQVARINQEAVFDMPRHVNVCFVNQEHTVIVKEKNLRPQTQYYLRIDIGKLSSDSAIKNPEKFPDHLLPQSEDGHWLEVIVLSDHFEIPGKRFSLFLPKTGTAWICNCQYNAQHQCAENQRERYLYVPLTSPEVCDKALLDIYVYFQNNLVQGIAMNAGISEDEQKGAGYSAYITHTLTKGLLNLNDLPARDINIKTAVQNDGKPHLVIKGEKDEIVTFLLDDDKTGTAISAVRQGLENIHFRTFGGQLGAKPQKENLLDGNNGKELNDFIEDIRSLAPLGYRLYTALLSDQPEKRKELPGSLLSKSTKIQVVRVHGEQIIFPWALIYDIPLESDPENFVECDVIAKWNEYENTLLLDANSCPFESKHGLNTLCPFGFWGFKHSIEQLPRLPKDGSLKQQIQKEEDPVEMAVGFSTELDTKIADSHFKHLRQTLTGVRLDEYSSRNDLRQAMGNTALELLYFYCHGRHDKFKKSDGTIVEETYLEIGTEERITPQDLYAWQDGLWDTATHWKDISPLVFINGCHTTDLNPEALINFVDAFASVYAAGVIGTEITVDQSLATEFAEHFFSAFYGGKAIGNSLKEARLNLLRKGNLLGMAYTPYCSVDLVLRKN